MKISVVTVCWNSEATIRDSVESFLSQTHADKELVVVDGLSQDRTLDIVRSYNSPHIVVSSEKDAGAFDAMNKGLACHTGDAVGILNSDDTFHDSGVLAAIAEGLADADIVFGDLHMVTDHRTKHLVREWRAGEFGDRAFQLGWMPPHPTFYVRRRVIDEIGNFDLSYRLAADYDLMLRAMVLHDFTVKYIPRVFADFMLGGLSTRSWKATLDANLECLRSRRTHLRAWPVDAALFLRPLRRIFQLRSLSEYVFRNRKP